jgi:hypothetical protein
MLNPTADQEQAWEAQRQAALKAHKQALIDVMALPDRESRRRFLVDYRNRWGELSADGLAMRVRQAWSQRSFDA